MEDERESYPTRASSLRNSYEAPIFLEMARREE
jgi:hypothetical protein